MSDRRGRWVAEFVLVVLGVLAAFAVENWRQSRSDTSVERHLLEGIAADLGRDLEDLEIAVLSARARIAATDDLLRLIGDTDAGIIVGPPPSNAPFGVAFGPEGGAAILANVRSSYAVRSMSPQQALLLAGHLLKFDVSDGSYSEARAGGQLDLIRDVDLRSAIAAYYYDAVRVRGTIDERLGSAVPRLVANLETGGLSPAGGTSDERIAAVIRQLPSVVAGLKNVRYTAALQIGVYLRLQAATERLRDRVTSSLGTDR